MLVHTVPRCPAAHLTKKKSAAVKCYYDNEDICEERHKCKDTMKCKKCKNEFKITIGFLRECKRKIKDG